MSPLLVIIITLLLYFSAQAAPGYTTVYITKTGEKYHDKGCQYLSKSCIEISLADAVDRGYGRCSKCSPPKLDESTTATVTTIISGGSRKKFTQEELDAAVKEAVAQTELENEMYLNQALEKAEKKGQTNTALTAGGAAVVLVGSSLANRKKREKMDKEIAALKSELMNRD